MQKHDALSVSRDEATTKLTNSLTIARLLHPLACSRRQVLRVLPLILTYPSSPSSTAETVGEDVDVDAKSYPLSTLFEREEAFFVIVVVCVK